MAAAGRHRLRATPSLIVLLVAAGVIGGLTYRLTETLVFLMTDESGGTEIAAFADIPPPESLRAPASTAPTQKQTPATEDGAGAETQGLAVNTAVEPNSSHRAAEEGDPKSRARPTLARSSPPAERILATGSPSPVGPPLTRIRFINWRLQPDGLGTEVILTGDGAITADHYEHTSLGGRLLVKIRDVEWPYPKRVIQVATPQLARIRTGFHRRPEGNELHIVLDLARPDASLREIRSEGSRLRLKITG